MNTASRQVEAVLNSVEFQERLAATTKLDIGAGEAFDLGQQLAMEAMRAAAKQSSDLINPEAFVWGCYKNCRRDALRRRERAARRFS